MNIKKILDKVLAEYHKGAKNLSEILDEELKKYNEEEKEKILEEIYSILGELYTPFSENDLVISELHLSHLLYKNSKNISKEILGILNKDLKAKKTLNEIAKNLYEGYNFRDKEILKATKVLPKYLKEAIKQKDKTILKEVNKLKTKPLRVAYKQIFNKLDNLSKQALNKLITTAYYEKMRYYSNRIADTETHRALMSKRAYEILNDNEVEFVKFTMSSRHPKVDICDFYANLDVGYGKGIIPKNEMRTTPLHPHCHCVYEPYYREVKGKKKSFKKAVNETMNKFSKYEQKEILSTYEMLDKFKAGEDIEKIFNILRPKYPIRKYIEVLDNIIKKFKENYLNLEKSGYFDEKFEELEIDEICKRVGIDKKDIDEIIKKTNFKVEGAIYYKKNGDRVFVKGGKNYIDVPFANFIDKFIHSHPTGTSFSAEDVMMAIENKIIHIIAFNDEYFYSLRFKDFNIEFDEEFIKSFKKYDKILTDKIIRGEITQTQKNFSTNHKIWKDLFNKIKGVRYDYYRIRK